MIAALLLALSLSEWWQRATRETNSFAANARGVKQFAQKKYAEAERSFGVAEGSEPSAAHAFNRGTAQIAEGRREEGAATLARAMKDPAFRAGALYNRGNAALAAKSYDYAIKDYIEALKLRPHDRNIKRNLEIAQVRKQEQQQANSGAQQNPQGANPDKQKPAPKSPGEGQQTAPQDGGENQMDALLRSVQQQEQEELARMKRQRGGRQKVGW
jgi:tetratricopeptide (TPR) repeat protein